MFFTIGGRIKLVSRMGVGVVDVGEGIVKKIWKQKINTGIKEQTIVNYFFQKKKKRTKLKKNIY